MPLLVFFTHGTQDLHVIRRIRLQFAARVTPFLRQALAELGA